MSSLENVGWTPQSPSNPVRPGGVVEQINRVAERLSVLRENLGGLVDSIDPVLSPAPDSVPGGRVREARKGPPSSAVSMLCEVEDAVDAMIRIVEETRGRVDV